MNQSAMEWYLSPKVQAWCDKQDKFRDMTAQEYTAQLTDLIEYAGTELSDKESHQVLTAAFKLLERMLGVRYKTVVVIPEPEDAA